jgi:hypothetical protein
MAAAISLILSYCLYISVQGATFAEVMEMTDIFEGSVIRLARRLDEFLNQVDHSPSLRCTLRPSVLLSTVSSHCMDAFIWLYQNVAWLFGKIVHFISNLCFCPISEPANS